MLSRLTHRELSRLLELASWSLTVTTPVELQEMLNRLSVVIPCETALVRAGSFGDDLPSIDDALRPGQEEPYVRSTFTFGAAQAFRTVVSLVGLDRGDLERAAQILTVIGPHVHEANRRVSSSGLAAAKAANPLSSREREVLHWAQQGKTYWEIAQILGISERTVKYHFARIKSKLDVVNPCEAVAKALRMGFIAWSA